MPALSSTAKVAVIGAGLGGLAAAAKLAHAGLRVSLFEKNATCGGKMSEFEAGGFRWDTGPSLLTMPHVLRDLWSSLGRRLEDDLEITPLGSTCRYRWADGTLIEEDADFWARPDVRRYLRHAKGIYDLSASAFLENAPDEMWRQFTPGNLLRLHHLPKVASRESLHDLNVRFFGKNRHLVQIFDRFATYNGSSPFQTPAVFSIIAYVQATFGGHYLQGGMVQLARKLTNLAALAGVEFHLSEEVHKIHPQSEAGFLIETNQRETFASHIVCNQDSIRASETILPVPYHTEKFKKRRPDPSTSGLVLFLGFNQRQDQLGHHNILFSNDYAEECRQIHVEQQLPVDPTIYISIANRTDRTPLRSDREAWFVLVNAPALNTRSGNAGSWDSYKKVVKNKLRAFHLLSPRAEPDAEYLLTPKDFADRHNAWRGTLYGFASHGLMSSFQRPSMVHPRLRNFYFTGGTTHPGGGVPLVLLSGQIVARKICREMGLPC